MRNLVRSGIMGTAPWRHPVRWLFVLGAGWLAWGVGVPESRGGLRDPFVFGPRADAVGAAKSPALTGILWDATQPLAILDGKPAATGHVIDAWTIVEIRQDAIVIERGERREVVTPGESLPAD